MLPADTPPGVFAWSRPAQYTSRPGSGQRLPADGGGARTKTCLDWANTADRANTATSAGGGSAVEPFDPTKPNIARTATFLGGVARKR